MLARLTKAHVAHRVSEAQINQFIQSWALLECVQKRMREFNYAGRAARTADHFKDASKDVAKLLLVFKQVIGTTWARAVQPNLVSAVTLGPQRLRVPWREVAEVMRRTGKDSPGAFVRDHVERLTPFYSWAP